MTALLKCTDMKHFTLENVEKCEISQYGVFQSGQLWDTFFFDITEDEEMEIIDSFGKKYRKDRWNEFLHNNGLNQTEDFIYSFVQLCKIHLPETEEYKKWNKTPDEALKEYLKS